MDEIKLKKELVKHHISENKINTTDLSLRAGYSRAYTSSVLNGSRQANHEFLNQIIKTLEIDYLNFRNTHQHQKEICHSLHSLLIAYDYDAAKKLREQLLEYIVRNELNFLLEEQAYKLLFSFSILFREPKVFTDFPSISPLIQLNNYQQYIYHPEPEKKLLDPIDLIINLIYYENTENFYSALETIELLEKISLKNKNYRLLSFLRDRREIIELYMNKRKTIERYTMKVEINQFDYLLALYNTNRMEQFEEHLELCKHNHYFKNTLKEDRFFHQIFEMDVSSKMTPLELQELHKSYNRYRAPYSIKIFTKNKIIKVLIHNHHYKLSSSLLKD